MPSTPRSTYRLQLTAEFTLHDAADLAGYLRDLGVDWFYLSPILQAGSGSTHGYDVVDHLRVDASRGGDEGLRSLSAAARAAGLGVLVDIVPNHMGVGAPAENAAWWSVLELGRASPYASWFDIDWDAGGGRVLVPVLADESVADVVVEGGEVRYFEHRFPLAPGTGTLDEQHYELVDWRRADSELNYRRFFAVNELAALRVEDPVVFEATHRLIVSWVRSGQVDGLRVDHPDGLADPGGYLDALAEATGGAYVLVEKILESGETLPPFWATAGTTGYDALADIDRVFVDPAGQRALDRLDASLRRGGPLAWSDLIHDTKRAIADGILNSEVHRLVRDLTRAGSIVDDPTALADAVAELLACFPVYRSYLPYGAEYLDAAVAEASRRRPELAGILSDAARVLADPVHPAAIRFQQTTGMVMAKGVEDTAFYRVSRLASLTEVGADPDEFSLGVDEFHARQQQRLAAQPASMTTLSTHDTKRGEDTRARISVLAEFPDDWAAFIARRRPRYALGDGALENVLWESIAGSWPREREALHAYAEKAAREAGGATTWSDPDESFEQRLHALVDAAFDDPEVNADLERFVALIRAHGWSNGLSAKLLQLTGPGVPDVYQGSELWEHSLVDPDNRRPVDFDERARLLAELDGGWRPPVDATGAAKLLVTSRALRARRDRPELFERYAPLPALGGAADHVVAVDRGGAVALATRLPAGLAAAGGWGDTTVLLPSGPYSDALTGRTVDGGECRVAELFAQYPVALLLREGS
ncbi:MAG TPA: malto-oligosyltrehalose synthase [Pseudolysinimonas sp.]|nr:malto-oligosyltrehalose synthase [Pseudolysinimonas sp.]